MPSDKAFGTIGISRPECRDDLPVILDRTSRSFPVIAAQPLRTEKKFPEIADHFRQSLRPGSRSYRQVELLIDADPLFKGGVTGRRNQSIQPSQMLRADAHSGETRRATLKRLSNIVYFDQLGSRIHDRYSAGREFLYETITDET